VSEAHGAGCHWCSVPEQHYSPVEHTKDGLQLFVEDALRRSREAGRKAYPTFGSKSQTVRINALDRKGRTIW